MKTLKDRLIWARTLKGERDGAEFTQQDLADKAGVSQGSIAHLESGRTKTARNVIAIAEALGVQARWLAEGKGLPFADGSLEKDWHAAFMARSGTVELPQPVLPQPAIASQAPAPTVSLIWVDAYDLELLTLAHSTDGEGRDKILRTAQRVPKFVRADSIRNQS